MEPVIDDLIGKFYTNDRVVELQKLADEQKWGFTERARFAEQPTVLQGFQLFKGKRGKRFLGIMTGRASSVNYTSRIYDYIYYSHGGKKKTTVIEIKAGLFDLGQFLIRPRKGITNMFRKKSRGSGIADFDRNYEIDALDPERTEMELPDSALVAISRLDDFRLEGEGKYLVLYRKGKQLPAYEILHTYALAREIAEDVLYDKEKDFV